MDPCLPALSQGPLRTPRSAHWVTASLEVPEEWGLAVPSAVPSAALMSKPLRRMDDSELKAIEKQQAWEELSVLPLCLQAGHEFPS